MYLLGDFSHFYGDIPFHYGAEPPRGGCVMEPETLDWIDNKISRLEARIERLEIKVYELESENERLKVLLETRRF